MKYFVKVKRKICQIIYFYDYFNITTLVLVYLRFNIVAIDYKHEHPFRIWMSPSGTEKRKFFIFLSLYKKQLRVIINSKTILVIFYICHHNIVIMLSFHFRISV